MSSSSLFSRIQALVKQDEAKCSHQEDLFLKTSDCYEKLNIKELRFAKANEKHVELHFATCKKEIRISLAKFTTENLRIELLRVHKSFAVNTDFIKSYTNDELMVGDVKIPIGRIYKGDVMERLKKLTLKP